MLKLVLFNACFSLTSLFLFAQDEDSWKVYHNKKLVIEATAPAETKNIISFQKADLQTEGYVLISYLEKLPKKDWQRTIAVYDEGDNLLSSKDGVRIMRLLHSEIKDLLKTHSKLRIFTWSLPNDPNIAAAVRVRRVHLCTIEWR